jgi:hypothetical protein
MREGYFMLSGSSLFQPNSSKYIISGEPLNEVQNKQIEELNLKAGTEVFFFENKLMSYNENKKIVRKELMQFVNEKSSVGVDVSDRIVFGALGSGMERVPSYNGPGQSNSK